VVVTGMAAINETGPSPRQSVSWHYSASRSGWTATRVLLMWHGSGKLVRPDGSLAIWPHAVGFW